MDEILKFISGSGEGSGSDDGSGSGSGSGDGWGWGSGIKISFAHSCPVTYIDGIPCIVRSAHSRWVKVSIIRTDDFVLKDAFVGRYETAIAHGKTIREAIEAAREKYFSGLDFDEQKERLLAEFAEKKTMTVKELYRWHGILTGSCEYGRSLFQSEHGLKDADELTLEQFVSLTKGSYGGDVIARLVKE